MKRTPPKPLTLRVLEKRGFLGELRITSMVFPCFASWKKEHQQKLQLPMFGFNKMSWVCFLVQPQQSTTINHQLLWPTESFPTKPRKTRKKTKQKSNPPRPWTLSISWWYGGFNALKGHGHVFRKDLEAMTKKNGLPFPVFFNADVGEVYIFYLPWNYKRKFICWRNGWLN